MAPCRAVLVSCVLAIACWLSSASVVAGVQPSLGYCQDAVPASATAATALVVVTLRVAAASGVDSAVLCGVGAGEVGSASSGKPVQRGRPCRTLGYALEQAAMAASNTSLPLSARPTAVVVEMEAGTYLESGATVTMPTAVRPAAAGTGQAVTLTCNATAPCPALVVARTARCVDVRGIAVVDTTTAPAINVWYVRLGALVGAVVMQWLYAHW